MLDHWYPSCVAFSEHHGLNLIPLLTAFGGPQTGPIRPFEDLEREALDAQAKLSKSIAASLPSIDVKQATMFERRFAAVCGVLGDMTGQEARVMFVGLMGRMSEVLKAPPPRALRVRAICDFYYSHCARIHHRGSTLSLKDAAQKMPWTQVAPGVRHGHIGENTKLGPIHVNILRLSPGARIRSVVCRERPFLDLIQEEGAVAGVSGGFFLYSEPDIEAPSQRNDPVGLLVDKGLCLPPVFRRSAVVQREGRFDLEQISMQGVTLDFGEAQVTVEAVNDPDAIGKKAVVFNRAYTGALEGEHRIAIVGDQVLQSQDIPLAGFVLITPEKVNASTTLRYRLPGAPLDAAMAGGPWLTPGQIPDLVAEDFAGSAPPQTFSQDETFDENLLPRMAAGLTDDGDLMFCAIDGRNFERAPGFTLRMTAELMHALGCSKAMNLDGGSSKRMIVGGKVVDLPSTEVVSAKSQTPSVRPIRTGILVFAAESEAP